MQACRLCRASGFEGIGLAGFQSAATQVGDKQTSLCAILYPSARDTRDIPCWAARCLRTTNVGIGARCVEDGAKRAIEDVKA